MSKKEIVDILNADTAIPNKIPSSWAGIGALLFVRFGIGIVVAIVFGFMMQRVYEDMQLSQGKLVEVVVHSTKAHTETAETIKILSDEIQNLSDIEKEQIKILERQSEILQRLSTK